MKWIFVVTLSLFSSLSLAGVNYLPPIDEDDKKITAVASEHSTSYRIEDRKDHGACKAEAKKKVEACDAEFFTFVVFKKLSAFFDIGGLDLAGNDACIINSAEGERAYTSCSCNFARVCIPKSIQN